jgi:hypothetical protein
MSNEHKCAAMEAAAKIADDLHFPNSTRDWEYMGDVGAEIRAAAVPCECAEEASTKQPVAAIHVKPPVPKDRLCSTCNGFGWWSDRAGQTPRGGECPICSGTGYSEPARAALSAPLPAQGVPDGASQCGCTAESGCLGQGEGVCDPRNQPAQGVPEVSFPSKAERQGEKS